MLTEEQETIENADPVLEKLSTVHFALTAILMCFAEFHVIHGYWFGPKQMTDGLDGFFVPIRVSCLAFLSIAIRFSLTNMAKAGQINSKSATMLKLNLGTLMVVAYIAILQLSKLGRR